MKLAFRKTRTNQWQQYPGCFGYCDNCGREEYLTHYKYATSEWYWCRDGC